MVPERDKPRQISLRPMAGIAIAVIGVGMLIAEGGPWRVAGYVMAVLTIALLLGVRVFLRRLRHAREPDPQSTLKI